MAQSLVGTPLPVGRASDLSHLVLVEMVGQQWIRHRPADTEVDSQQLGLSPEIYRLLLCQLLETDNLASAYQCLQL